MYSLRRFSLVFLLTATILSCKSILLTYGKIEWPEDYCCIDCLTGSEPDGLTSPYGRPLFRERKRDIIGVNYKDESLGADNDGFYTTIRTWGVYDWRKYSKESGFIDGVNMFRHQQILTFKTN